MRISDWSSDVCSSDLTVSIVLDRTPFYAESGGQVGDTGRITTDTGSGEVLNTTYALPGLPLHQVRLADGEIKAGQEAVAAIAVDRRSATRRNTTRQHILHWAIRGVRAKALQQQGSPVPTALMRLAHGPHT